MKTGMRAPFTGLMTQEPVKTPVLGLSIACRSLSVRRAAEAWYAATASAGVAAPPVHAPRVPSGHADVIRPPTVGCSGARTMYAAANIRSGSVVNNSIIVVGDVKLTFAPPGLPLQLLCIIVTFS